MRLAPPSARALRRIAELLVAAGLCCCGGDLQLPEPGSFAIDEQALSCSLGCGGQLGYATLPGPAGTVTLTAWSNSPQLGTSNDCDPTACAGTSPLTAQNGQLSYGCPWQCVELVNRYFQGTWGDPKIAADAGAGFCQRAASSSLPQYYVYGQYGASTSGHAPVAGDVLVWSSHVAIATNSMSAGAAGTISVIAQNATCSGADTVAWNGSMFGAKYGLSALCWVHVMANTGATGPMCPTGSNWNLAGYYCGDEPGMQNAAASTLYSCASAGGAASVVQVCSAGCQHMPAGQNDRCASPQPNGASCTAKAQCQSSECVSGVCCNSACGACGSCATGTCTPLAAGNAGSPSCSPFLCDGASVACRASCSADGDCISGDYCKAGACIGRQTNGAACSGANQCQSAHCVSAVCCDSACGPCGSCAAGTCAPLAAHSAGQPSCSNGLLCSGSSASCPSGCTTSADCVSGMSCVGSACVPQIADGGSDVDAGIGVDAGSEVDAGIDAGTPAAANDGSHPEAAAVGNGCASGGAAWSAGAALVVWLVGSRRRRSSSLVP